MVIENNATAAADRSTPGEDKLLLTVEEAARQLGVGRTVMYRLISTGAVESVTLGKLRRIPSECLAEFVSVLRRHDNADDRRRVTAA